MESLFKETKYVEVIYQITLDDEQPQYSVPINVIEDVIKHKENCLMQILLDERPEQKKKERNKRKMKKGQIHGEKASRNILRSKLKKHQHTSNTAFHNTNDWG